MSLSIGFESGSGYVISNLREERIVAVLATCIVSAEAGSSCCLEGPPKICGRPDVLTSILVCNL